ncbi:MAG: exodeoxyribonuclease VII small subunit [Alphaproteobacteria bacterium]|nr:MAG: exodeoxyribonuclease VII small subunit [Alphaproteobacteria bacterium]
MAEEDSTTPDGVEAGIAELSFEQALSELEGIVQRLERGEAGLDESIALYERGAALKRHCEAKLRDAELRIEKIELGADGEVKLKEADTP